MIRHRLDSQMFLELFAVSPKFLEDQSTLHVAGALGPYTVAKQFHDPVQSVQHLKNMVPNIEIMRAGLL